MVMIKKGLFLKEQRRPAEEAAAGRLLAMRRKSKS
jgi:hypothetical protein